MGKVDLYHVLSKSYPILSYPQDFEILGWCPVGPILPHGVMIKMPYGVDALHRPALHPIFSYWIG